VDAFIDNEYIQNGGQKIDMYQRLAVVSSKEELDELRRELEDRYGRPSPYVEKLLQVTETRLEAKAQGMVLIAQKKDILEIKWRRVSDMPDLSKLEKPLRSRFRLIPSIPVMVRVSLAGVSDILDFIQTLLTAFSSLRKGDSRD
ncbi:MAG: TRCF domain-containing protein, partial [Megasphaera sp.]